MTCWCGARCCTHLQHPKSQNELAVTPWLSLSSPIPTSVFFILSLPLPDPAHSRLTLFFFPLEFRLPGLPVAQACWSLLLSPQPPPTFSPRLMGPAPLQAAGPSRMGHPSGSHLLLLPSLLPGASIIGFLYTARLANYSLHLLSD